ncbi:hypothetical protein [Nonomuraea gerenzanensis]|uniref:hypothetical protein n=1 Tax=Nonomuraea gerenzanensis TaxID=93944 RepID=UPI001CDA30E1|nr:hypothetical protein [Nonomuraea gerenzanensis]UBU09783.1 hypothetical protein LCN96_36220 [Nonomuraea gerenzanensis]
MSHKRSGLLSGLIVGLLAALLCAAGLGAAILFQQRLPSAVMSFGGGLPVSLALSLLIAVVVALAIGAVRPRSLTLLPVAALYAGGAVAAGQVTGKAVMDGAALRTPGRPSVEVGDVTLENFNAGLGDALSLYRGALTETWAAWLCIAVAALAALALVTLRVVRVRRAQRAEAATRAEAEAEQEPEYRAPFEPAQQPAPKPSADLFTPRDPARD